MNDIHIQMRMIYPVQRFFKSVAHRIFKAVFAMPSRKVLKAVRKQGKSKTKPSTPRSKGVLKKISSATSASSKGSLKKKSISKPALKGKERGKKKKRTAPVKIDTPADINSLPDKVLSTILEFCPSHQAVRTRGLSRAFLRAVDSCLPSNVWYSAFHYFVQANICRKEVTRWPKLTSADIVEAYFANACTKKVDGRYGAGGSCSSGSKYPNPWLPVENEGILRDGMSASYYRTLFVNVSNFWRARQIEGVKDAMQEANERMYDEDAADEPFSDRLKEFQGQLCDIFGIDPVTFFDRSDAEDETHELEIC